MCSTSTFTCFPITFFLLYSTPSVFSNLSPFIWIVSGRWRVFMHDTLVFFHAHFSLPALFCRSIFSLGFSSLFIVELLSVWSAVALSVSSCLLKTYLRYMLHTASLLIDRSSLEETICTLNTAIDFFFSWSASFNVDRQTLLMKIIAVLGKPY